MILFTGATANVGRELVRLLAGRNADAVAASRAPKPRGDVPLRRFSFTEPKTWRGALERIDRVFLVRPPQSSRVKRDIEPFLAFAREQGASERSCSSAVVGAGDLSFIPHGKIEKAILRLGFTPRSSAPDSSCRTSRRRIGEDPLVTRDRGPCWQGKDVLPGACETLQTVAALALTSDHLDNRSLDLVGKDVLSYYDVAKKLTEAIGES